MRKLENRRTIPRRIWKVVQRNPYVNYISIPVFWVCVFGEIVFINRSDWILVVILATLIILSTWFYNRAYKLEKDFKRVKYSNKKVEKDLEI